MPSLTEFRIEFDRPGATYAPGETVTGCVLISVSKEKYFRGLRLSAKGEAETHWTENERVRENGRSRTTTKTYRGSEQYFSLEYTLLGTPHSDSRVDVPVGVHRYNFGFILPLNIPCSFEHKNAHIRYTAKAIIDRPWKFDHTCKAAFTVVTNVDLNAHPQARFGVNDDIYTTFCNFCCFDNGSLKAEVMVPVSGFVPGQTIDTTIKFQKPSGGVQLTKICTKLHRYMVLRAKTPSNSKRHDRADIKESKSNGPFDQEGVTNLPIVVPPIPPSDLKYCSIIELNYFLRVCLHVSGCHKKIRRDYPIIIGTLPLYPTATAPPMTPGEEKYIPPIEMPNAPPPNWNYPTPFNPGVTGQPSTGGYWVPPMTSQYAGPSSSAWTPPPPSYEECMDGAQHIKEHDESDYVHGANQAFTPRYPVFSIPAPNWGHTNSGAGS